MAAEASYRLNLSLTGLGQLIEANYKATTTTTPTRSFYNYLVQASADTEEQLTFGDVATVNLLIIKCVTNDVDIDLDFVSSFDVDLTVEEGEFCVIPNPSGSVYIKNNDSAEQSTIEIYAIGS